MDPLKKVKEDKTKHSTTKPLKLQWTSLVEKHLGAISSSAVSPSGELLAIARETPSLEFYSIQEGRLILVTVHALPKHQLLSRVQWLNDRLVASVSLNGLVSVFSLAQMTPLFSLQVCDCVWDLVVVQGASPQLVMACDDGLVRVYRWVQEEEQESTLEFVRQSRQVSEKCISVSCLKGIIYALYSDGIVRKMEGNDLRVSLAISHGKGEQPRVLCCLQEGVVGVGLSDGALVIYETAHGTQQQKFQQHIADILTILPVRNEQGVCTDLYYSGSDSRVVHLTKVGERLEQASQDRGQSHDVTCLAVLPGGYLVAGGLSTDLCLYQLDNKGAFPTRHFGKQVRRLRHVRQVYDTMMLRTVQHKDSVLVLVNLQFSLQLFRIDKHNKYQFIIEIKSQWPIVTHDLSKEGNLIAYSTLKETRVLLVSGKDKVYTVERATLEQDCLPAAQVISFGRQSDLLYCLSQNQLSSFDIITSSSSPLLTLPSGVVYSQIQQTKNEKFLAVAGKSADEERLEVVDTDSNKIIYSLQKYLPKRMLRSFKIDGERLFVLYDNSKFIVVDFIKNQVNKRSKNLLSKFPKQLLQMENKVEEVVVHPGNSQKVMLVGVDYYVTVFLDHEVLAECVVVQNREEVDTAHRLYPRSNFDIIRRDQPIIGAVTLDKSVLLVQSSWSSLLSSVQQPVFSKKFIR